MTQRISKGFVLVFHCVHWDIEPAIEGFWYLLRTRMRAQRRELLMFCVVPLQFSKFFYLCFLFYLLEFCDKRSKLQATSRTTCCRRINIPKILSCAESFQINACPWLRKHSKYHVHTKQTDHQCLTR